MNNFVNVEIFILKQANLITMRKVSADAYSKSWQLEDYIWYGLQ